MQKITFMQVRVKVIGKVWEEEVYATIVSPKMKCE